MFMVTGKQELPRHCLGPQVWHTMQSDEEMPIRNKWRPCRHEDSGHRHPGKQSPPASLPCSQSPTLNIEIILSPGRRKWRCEALKISLPTCHGKQLHGPHWSSLWDLEAGWGTASLLCENSRTHGLFMQDSREWASAPGLGAHPAGAAAGG